MQCTPDLEEDDCLKCLSVATNVIHNCCSRERKLSGISMSTNCYFWYAHHIFLPKTSLLISTPSPQT
ncbi:putative Gnk2-like domain-containing protein [Helianthus anomalus]